MQFCNRKIGIARDPADGFEFPSNWFAQLFMENQAVLARGSGKLFSTSFGQIKVVMEAPFFMVAPKISTFWLIFVEVFHCQRVNQAPNTSQDSSLTRWEPVQDDGGSQFSMSQTIFVVSPRCLQNTIFGSLEKSSKSMSGKPRSLLRPPEAHRLRRSTC